MLENYPDVLTVQELIKALRVGRNNAYRMLKQGIIKNTRVGNKIIIPKKCLIEFLESDNQSKKTAIKRRIQNER